ncbi:AraC family transcriptional regulator [Paenibacillus sp. P46E]
MLELPYLKTASITVRASTSSIDLSYFSRAFKKHYGQGPQSYRREYNGS